MRNGERGLEMRHGRGGGGAVRGCKGRSMWKGSGTGAGKGTGIGEREGKGKGRSIGMGTGKGTWGMGGWGDV